MIKGKNEMFLDKYHRQLINIRNKLLTYKDCCDRKRLTYLLQTGEEIAKEHNYKLGKPNWKEILEQWKCDKYDSYYFFPNDLNERYTHKQKLTNLSNLDSIDKLNNIKN